jgi:hypothetical protein
MKTPEKCSTCGGNNLEPGMLTARPFVFFAPDKGRSLFRLKQLEVTDVACVDCGVITMHTDKDKLKEAVQDK